MEEDSDNAGDSGSESKDTSGSSSGSSSSSRSSGGSSGGGSSGYNPDTSKESHEFDDDTSEIEGVQKPAVKDSPLR